MILLIIALIIATEALTELIVDSKIFEPIRQKLKELAFPIINVNNPQPPRTHTIIFRFISNLTDCGYCTSVWVAALIIAFTNPPEFKIVDNIFINWLILSLVLHRLSNLYHVLYMIIKNGRIKTYDFEVKLWNSSTKQ